MLILVPTGLEFGMAFPEIALPAVGQAALLASRTSFGEPAWVAPCGFGLSAAGARAAAAWSRVPGPACLVGLAGTLDASRCPVGSLVLATAVEVEGIGFGTEEAFLHPAATSGPLAREWERQIPPSPWTPPLPVLRAPLLSVASASGDASHARLRRERHPGCVAEEMEGESVLQAAAALGRPLAILRGISNEAGDRDPSRWRSRAAMEALREALDAWLKP